MKWLYSISIFGNLLYNCFVLKCIFTRTTKHVGIDELLIDVFSCTSKWSNWNAAIYTTLDFLVMFSSMFYICILISVRSITRLASSLMKNRPEKVIIYQTLVLLIVKLLCIPTIFMIFQYLKKFEFVSWNGILNMIYYPLFFIDVLTTPIVFQITYIFCNKTNLEALLKMNFRKLKTWRAICCGINSNDVEDYHESYILSNTT
ncbi:unnamed protein product [Caenorhabditis angaria]|uniref:Serpentine receptor class gamma n=1 Tax=Caenorhabditis angaria TaxID=860376 RepID=A0A9P1ISY4_9PELO|nr:unnamed protein product [Caenorhabditis angaria]